MRKILTLLLVLASITGYSQVQFLGNPKNTVKVQGGLTVDSLVKLIKTAQIKTADTTTFKLLVIDADGNLSGFRYWPKWGSGSAERDTIYSVDPISIDTVAGKMFILIRKTFVDSIRAGLFGGSPTWQSTLTNGSNLSNNVIITSSDAKTYSHTMSDAAYGNSAYSISGRYGVDLTKFNNTGTALARLNLNTNLSLSQYDMGFTKFSGIHTEINPYPSLYIESYAFDNSYKNFLLIPGGTGSGAMQIGTEAGTLYTFPRVQPTVGQVLRASDGAGILEWANPPGTPTGAWLVGGNIGIHSTGDSIGTKDMVDVIVISNNSEIARFGGDGNYNIALGLTSVANGYASFAVGNMANSSGQVSISMGNQTNASGNYSIALGNLTAAIGEGSVALGTSTSASGVNSFAAGKNTVASGNYSLAMNRLSISHGENSTALGLSTDAKSKNSLVIGRFNDVTNSTDDSTQLFAIGNGYNSISRHNILTATYNGIGINTTAPTAALHINGTFRLADGTQSNGYVLTTDANGNASWQATSGRDKFGEQFTGSTSTTLTLANSATTGTVRVFRNGIRLNSSLYSASGTTVTLVDSRETTDILLIDYKY